MAIKHYAYMCVWCGAHSDSTLDRFKPCCAPDGDGHLFKITEIKNIYDSVEEENAKGE